MFSLKKVKSAHLEWLNELANVFAIEGRFEGELDYTQCTFGDWYYSFLESDDFEAMPPHIQTVLLDLEEPHSELHMAADDIVELIEQPDEQSLNRPEKYMKREPSITVKILKPY